MYMYLHVYTFFFLREINIPVQFEKWPQPSSTLKILQNACIRILSRQGHGNHKIHTIPFSALNGKNTHIINTEFIVQQQNEIKYNSMITCKDVNYKSL